MYYLIYNSDGDTIVSKVTKKEILRMKSEEGWCFYNHEEFERDTNYWGDKMALIIKGGIVAPFEKSVVTEYDIQ